MLQTLLGQKKYEEAMSDEHYLQVLLKEEKRIYNTLCALLVVFIVIFLFVKLILNVYLANLVLHLLHNKQ